MLECTPEIPRVPNRHVCSAVLCYFWHRKTTIAASTARTAVWVPEHPRQKEAMHQLAVNINRMSIARPANVFEGACPQSIDFEEILSRANGNFEQQNQVLELSIIIINFCIINIISTYYNYFV